MGLKRLVVLDKQLQDRTRNNDSIVWNLSRIVMTNLADPQPHAVRVVIKAIDCTESRHYNFWALPFQGNIDLPQRIITLNRTTPCYMKPKNPTT